MDTQCGSYQYDSLEKQSQVQELERLYRQASAFLDTERAIWPSLNIGSGQQVLDVGCGPGIVTHELAKAVQPAQVTGVDISQSLLETGRSICPNSDQLSGQKNTVFKEGSVYDLPFPSKKFDVVYARLLFQHLDEPLVALKNILRVLKPGGLLCILDIDKDWSSLYPEPNFPVQLDEAIAKGQAEQGGDPWVGRKLGHYLKSTGFADVSTNISMIDSDRLGLENFVNMLSFGKSLSPEQSELTSIREEIRPSIQAFLDSPHAWAGFGLFVVKGHKPR